MKFYFRMWLDILRSNKYTTSFQEVVVRYVWSCPKWCQIVVQLDLKKKWVIKLFFCTGLSSDRSWNLIQSFQVVVARHAQSQDWIELWCWFFPYGQATLEAANSFIHFNKFTSLAFEFWSLNPLCQPDCLILYVKYLQNVCKISPKYPQNISKISHDWNLPN